MLESLLLAWGTRRGWGWGRWQGEGELDRLPHLPFSPVCGSKACVSFSLSLVSLIRGQVVTTDGTPLIGVNVSFVKYPKYGYTITRQDGT